MAHVLIIDDEASIRSVIRRILEIEGHRSSEAADGNQGIRICAAEKPDLVITDLIMPNKEGIETIIELRRTYPEVKIIAISGGAGLDPSSFLSAAKALGADSVLRKPFRVEELASTIRELLTPER